MYPYLHKILTSKELCFDNHTLITETNVLLPEFVENSDMYRIIRFNKAF
jgi:hypothetical protein